MSLKSRRDQLIQFEEKVFEARALAQTVLKWGVARVLQNVDERLGITRDVILRIEQLESTGVLVAELVDLSLPVITQAWIALIERSLAAQFGVATEHYRLLSLGVSRLASSDYEESNGNRSLHRPKVVLKWLPEDRDRLVTKAQRTGLAQDTELTGSVVDANGLIIFQVDCRLLVSCARVISGESRI